jgi:hypothetical protein
VEKVSQLIPIDEELKKLKEFDGDLKDVSETEQYLLKLIKIQRIKERLSCFIFKLSFDEDFRNKFQKIKQFHEPF